MSRSYYDDNFGAWDIEDEDGMDFYNQVQAESVRKRCEGCGGMFKLRPEYYICNGCAETLERGGDLAWPDKNED